MQGLVALEVMEELGYGLDRMVAAMTAAGLPRPEFADRGGTFVVTLFGHGARLVGGVDVSRRHQESAPTALTLNERQAWALEQLRTAGPLTARAYADAHGVSPATALRDLRALVARGLVEASGTTNDRRYRLRVDGGTRAR